MKYSLVVKKVSSGFWFSGFKSSLHYIINKYTSHNQREDQSK